MSITIKEIKNYKNFNEMASDVIKLASQIMPEKLIYINALTEGKQHTLKVSDTNKNINLKEGLVIDLDQGICNRVDFVDNKPLIYEDISKETSLDNLQKLLQSVNINAYMGIPIKLETGENFGTLCAAYHEKSSFNDDSVEQLQRIAKMFAYYLDVENKAYKDELTQLYNRKFLYDFYKEIRKEKGFVVFLDLDGFKAINDQLGHDVGDEVLKETADKLTDLITPHEFAKVFRLGGDEFVLLIPHITSSEMTEFAIKINQTLSHFDKANHLSLTATLGVKAYSEKDELKQLLKQADLLLYKAKEKGKNRFLLED